MHREDVLVKHSKCPKCLVTLKPGVAIKNTLMGIGDFSDSDIPITLSETGQAVRVVIMKCPTCGYSRES